MALGERDNITNYRGSNMKQWFLTFTAQLDSSKLERKPCVRNGLYFSGPVASNAHASQLLGETSKIEETTETDILLDFTSFAEMPWIENQYNAISYSN